MQVDPDFLKVELILYIIDFADHLFMVTEFDVIAVVFLYFDMTGIVYYCTNIFCADSSQLIY